MALVKSKPRRAQDKFTVDVKVQLTHLGMTVTELASELGLSRTLVSLAINNNVHRTTRKAVADFLKVSLPDE